MENLPIPRPKRGRPFKSEGERLVQESFRYSQEQRAKMKAYADKKGITLSEAICDAIYLFLFIKDMADRQVSQKDQSVNPSPNK